MGDEGGPALTIAPAADDAWHGLQRELPLTDLVVMAPSAARGEGPWTGLLAEAMMAGRAPVLIAGAADRMAGAPRRWPGTAVPRPAAPCAPRSRWLVDASEVAILQYTGELHETAGSAADPERLVGYLKAHGVAAASVRRLSGPRSGEALLGAAVELNASLFVAGAFGHARLAETVFGGATRTFLHAEDGMHLFLSH